MRSTFEEMTKSTREYRKNDKQMILTLRLLKDKTVVCGSEKDGTPESKHNSSNAKRNKAVVSIRDGVIKQG